MINGTIKDSDDCAKELIRKELLDSNDYESYGQDDWYQQQLLGKKCHCQNFPLQVYGHLPPPHPQLFQRFIKA